jgi:hypothetical protein
MHVDVGRVRDLWVGPRPDGPKLVLTVGAGLRAGREGPEDQGHPNRTCNLRIPHCSTAQAQNGPSFSSDTDVTRPFASTVTVNESDVSQDWSRPNSNRNVSQE